MQGRTNFLWSFTRLSVSTDMRAIRKSHAFLSGLICPFNKFTVWTFKCHIRCVCVCARVGGCLNATSGNEVISLLWVCTATGCCPQLHVGLLMVWEKASFSAGLSPSADWCREVAGPSVRPDLPLDGVRLLIPTPSHHTPNSAVEEGPSKKTFSLSLCRHPKETHSHNLTSAPDSLNSSGMHVLPAISETSLSLSAFWHWQNAWLSHSASQKCIPPTPSLLLSLSVKSTSIYAANCHTKADNCTEKNSSPCCDWEHAGSEISPPSHQRSWARFPLPYYKVEMSVCTRALTHSTLLLIVTSMQELKVKLNCLLCIKFKKEKKTEANKEY